MRRGRNQKVIQEFGAEWAKFKNDQIELEETLERQFEAYSAPLKNFDLTKKIVAADFGAGSGRWDKFFAKFVNQLILVEPSQAAIAVAREKLSAFSNVSFKNESVESCSIESKSLDLAISLGVLHHTDDTSFALKCIQEKIKPGGIFLGYLYYNLENKSYIYRLIWKISDLIRVVVSKLPKVAKLVLAEVIAVAIYFPLARFSSLLEKSGRDAQSIPLHHYANMPLYIMRNDALDRFGTRIERRFSRAEISELLFNTGFDVKTLYFSESEPFWTFAVQNKS